MPFKNKNRARRTGLSALAAIGLPGQVQGVLKVRHSNTSRLHSAILAISGIILLASGNVFAVGSWTYASTPDRITSSTGSFVGIGLTPPNPGVNKLDVSHTVTSGTARVFNTSMSYGTLGVSNVANYFTASGTTASGKNLTTLHVNSSGGGTGGIYTAVFTGGRVGVGLTTPANLFDVEGGAAIGAAYSGTNVAPTNGLIVEGRVGIGITAPTVKLEVSVPSGTEDILALNQNSKRMFLLQGADNGTAASLGMYNNAGTLVNRLDARPTQATFFNAGNVGIGTSTPLEKLQVAGGSVLLDNDRWVKFKDAAGTPALAMGLRTTNLLYFGGSTSINAMGWDVDGGTPDMYLANGGKLGIGVSWPTASLHTNGPAILGGRLTINTTSDQIMMQSYDQTDATWRMGTYIGSSGPNRNFTFWESGLNRNVMTFKQSDGSVGIGTVDPQSLLHVAGNAKVDGSLQVASVKTATWTVAPDYVFEKGYKLASLEEVDTFVKKNKHLPEVPSAKEFKEKGMDLAEMNFTLLKKVEELTLHVIKQNEEMKRQAGEIRLLKRNR